MVAFVIPELHNLFGPWAALYYFWGPKLKLWSELLIVKYQKPKTKQNLFNSTFCCLWFDIAAIRVVSDSDKLQNF